MLRSRVGYAFDSAAPVGGVVVASPTYYRIAAELRGVAAHAGLRPENGRSAILAAARAIADMRLGRIDAETTANIGTIEGGSAANVVPDRCRVAGEARSLDAARAEQLASEIVECLADAANDPECECDLDVAIERQFDGYRVRAVEPRGGARVRRAARLRLRAAADRHRRRQRRQRAARARPRRAQPRQRHRAQPRAGRAHRHRRLEAILDIAFALVERAGTA